MTRERAEHEEQPDEGREGHGEATDKTTEKTATKSPRQIVLAYVRNTSCRFLVLTLLRFFLTIVLGLPCAFKTVRSVRLCR